MTRPAGTARAYDVELAHQVRAVVQAERGRMRAPSGVRGRKTDGCLRVDAEAVEADDDLRRWVGSAVTYARPLPPK